jgi:hypothetical protein
MKIALNLSLQNLKVLIYCYDSFVKPLPCRTREAKVARSILDKTVISFKKKEAAESFTPTLFSKPKKFKVKLEIYEAHYLEQFVLMAECQPLSDYDRNVLHYVKSHLNQQLA